MKTSNNQIRTDLAKKIMASAIAGKLFTMQAEDIAELAHTIAKVCHATPQPEIACAMIMGQYEAPDLASEVNVEVKVLNTEQDQEVVDTQTRSLHAFDALAGIYEQVKYKYIDENNKQRYSWCSIEQWFKWADNGVWGMPPKKPDSAPKQEDIF